MSTVREQFEEIWPVPEGIYWNNGLGEYIPLTSSRTNLAVEWDGRLDTFTRCQESMGPVFSLMEEMVLSLGTLTDECLASDFNEHWESYTEACNIVDRAKQKLEQIK